MAQFRRSLKIASSAVAALFLLQLSAAGLDVPAGTSLHIRLKTKVATNASKPGQALEAILVAPVMHGAEFAIPAGSILRGEVEKALPVTRAEERALLQLSFSQLEIEGTKHKLQAKVVSVDNARERVDDTGRILGILASETISAQLDRGIESLGQRYGGFAEVLSAAKGALLKNPEIEIVYEPGIELNLELTAPLSLPKPSGPGPAAGIEPIEDRVLIDLAQRATFQTFAQKPPKPSDITNLMLIGTEQQVATAFKEAGWSTAAALSAESKLETFRAIAELRGYKEAPMSILLLDGRPPDMVFQKQNNTFAQRHHLRVWRIPETWRDRPVWVIAATHDTGIEFSQENRTFIHTIDPQIDRERAKVVHDFVLAGQVQGIALVDRPAVPKKSRNATGDALETDGRIAVMVLK